jgi:hypothetical protein
VSESQEFSDRTSSVQHLMHKEPGRPLSKTKLAEVIGEVGIIVTVRVPNEQHLPRVATALLEGGIRALELDYTTIRSSGSPIQELKVAGSSLASEP